MSRVFFLLQQHKTTCLNGGYTRRIWLETPGVSGRAKARQHVLHDNKCMAEEWSVIHPRCQIRATSLRLCRRLDMYGVAVLATVSSSQMRN